MIKNKDEMSYFILLQSVDTPSLRESTYELVYNAACALIGRGNYAEAEKKLRLAEKLWKEALEDEDDEIYDEIHILK